MTKFLIVACAVLCLLLASLTVAYTANADKIVAALNSERAEKLAAQADASQQVSQRAAEAATQKAEFEAVSQSNAQLRKDLDQLNATIASLRAEKEKAIAEATAIGNRIGQLSAANETQTSLIKNYRDEVSSLRNEQLTLNRQAVELVDKLNDLQSQREVLEQTARALREQLAEAQLAIQNAASGNRPDAKGQAFESTGPLIRGTVTDIVRSPAGDELVVIDVGANKGVQENMKMSIVRGDTFIADVVITRTDPGQAVGRVDKLGRSVQVSKGDGVRSRLQ